MKKINYSIILSILVIIMQAASACAGTVIVANDEWTLSDTGFGHAPEDTERFVNNIASVFTSGSHGVFHAYSNNFSYTGTRLPAALAAAGHTYTAGTGFAFTPKNISIFDGLFLGGKYLNAEETDTLIDYVYKGGNVYIAGGTRFGGPDREADAWDAFLGEFGMAFQPEYNGIHGNIPVGGTDNLLFAGVEALYQNSGSSISGSGIIISKGEHGLYALAHAQTVPVPSASLLLAGGLAGLAFARQLLKKPE
jgi:hypothetical protein